MKSAADSTDPYDGYRRLRQESPVTREAGGPWQVARYEDVRRVLRDHETFSSEVVNRPREGRRAASMLFNDPPVHDRLRKLVGKAFSPKQIGPQRELITARCEELMLAMSRQVQTDLISALAAPLPVTIIAQ